MACLTDLHCNNVIMSAMASQLTNLTIVYSIVYSGADQIKHQSSVSLAFVRGIHRWPVSSPHKGPVTRKMFPSNGNIFRVTGRHHVYHLLNMITYIPSQWLAIQTNPNIPKELKQVTTTAVWFNAGGSDIRKFNPWFATKVPYRSLYVWIVGEWMTTRTSLCYLLFLIISKITNSRYRYNVVHYGTILHMALQWLRQKINKIQSESSYLCRA